MSARRALDAEASMPETWQEACDSGLRCAVALGDLIGARACLSRGADAQALDRRGDSALHLAAKEGDTVMVSLIKQLSQFPLDLGLRNGAGWTAAQIALQHGYRDTACALGVAPYTPQRTLFRA